MAGTPLGSCGCARRLLLATLALLAPPLPAAASPASDVHRLRAERFAAEGRCEDALEAGGRARSLDPDDARVPLLLGKCEIRLRRYSEAVAALEAARRLDPSLSRVDLYLGIARFHQGDVQGAADALDAARATGVSGAEIELYEGLVLLQRGDARAAADKLEAARRADPEAVEPIASYYAGLAWERARERGSAETALRRVTERARGTIWADAADRALGRVAPSGPGRTWLELTAGFEYDDNVVLRGSGVTVPREIAGQTDARGVWIAEVGHEAVRTADWTLGVLATYYGSAHTDLIRFNTHYPVVSLWLDRRLSEAWTARLQYDFGYAWLDFDPFLSAHTLSPAVYYDWGRAGTSRAYARLFARSYFFGVDDFPDANPSGTGCQGGVTLCGPFGLNEEVERNRDGNGFAVGLEHRHPVPGFDLVVRGGYEFEHFGARGSEYSWNGHELRLGAVAALPFAFVLDVEGSYTYRPYRNPSTFPDLDDIPALAPPGGFAYPLSNVRRRDDRFAVDVVLERAVNEFLTLSARYAYFDNQSNTAVYDYRREIVGVYATVRFQR